MSDPLEWKTSFDGQSRLSPKAERGNGGGHSMSGHCTSAVCLLTL